MRITRIYDDVQNDLAAIDAPALSTSSATDPEIDPETLIEERWGDKIDEFLPSSIKPDKFHSVSKSFDPQVLAAIEVLSSFTHGQSRLAREVLVEAIAVRTEADQVDPADKHPVVRKQDVAVAIEIVYERAGVRETNITKIKSETARGRERTKAAKDKKKAAGGKGKKKDGDGDQGGQGGQAVQVF
jgi:hypothetical protein